MFALCGFAGKVETMTEAQRRKETYRLELEQQMAEAKGQEAEVWLWLSIFLEQFNIVQ